MELQSLMIMELSRNSGASIVRRTSELLPKLDIFCLGVLRGGILLLVHKELRTGVEGGMSTMVLGTLTS